jgi:two-component system LytT family response regulator
MTSYKAIVIDDEPAARRIVKFLCTEYAKSIEIIGEAENGATAVQLIKDLRPDLIFLDIQLPDKTGFQVLQELVYSPNVIFITAYEQFAINAFETFAVDYLLKPVKDDRFVAAINKLTQFGKINQKVEFNELSKLIDQLRPKPVPTAFPITVNDKIILLEYDDIAYLEADDKYVKIFSVDGNKYLTDLTLTALEEKLPDNFLRVKKSFIINKKKIKEMHKHFNGRYVLVIGDKNNSRIITGSTFATKVKSAFGLI